MSAQQIASPLDRAASLVHRLWPALALLLAAPAQAGTNEWTSMGLQGGTIYDLAFHPTAPSTMYAAAPNGFYKSTDSGATWQQASTPTSYYLRPSALAVTPAYPDLLHIALRDGSALRSVDRGSTLAHAGPVNLPGQLSSWSIAASVDGSAIYYGIDASVIRSTDQGATRQLRGTLPLPVGAIIGQLHVDRNDPQTVYAVAYGGIYRSTDGAASWQPLFPVADTNLDGVWGMAVDPQNASRLWLATNTSLRVTVNGGSSWNSVLDEVVSDIDIDPANPDVVYASLLDGAVMRTIDGGVSWTSLVVPQRAQIGRPKLAIVPNQSQRLYLFGSTGIFSSNDGGATWQRADAGIDATSPGGFSQITAGAQPIYFPIAEYGIGLVRSDGTEVDVLLSPPLSFVGGAHPPYVTAVIAGGDQSRNLVAAFSRQYLGFSTNHGSHWTRASAGPPTGLQINALARAVTGSRTVYAATSAGIYRSEDDGDHWVASSTGLPADTEVGPIVVTRNPMVLFAAVNDLPNAVYSIYKSTDGGINWAAAGDLHKRLVGTLVTDPNDEQSLIVGTNEGAFRTANGGASWTTLQMFPAQASGPVSSIAIDPLDSRIIYFGDFGRLFRSVDGGATFQNLMADYYIAGSVFSVLIRTEQPDRIIASMEGNGVREFSISPDLQVTAGPNGSVAPGTQTSFTFTVTNRGPFDATSIRLEAQLTGAATGISATSSNGTCTVAASSITCNADVLRTDGTLTVNLLGTPSASGTLRADATVSARQPDSVSTNNSASRTLTVTSASAPSTGGGGGGGGGAVSVWLLWALALLGLRRIGR